VLSDRAGYSRIEVAEIQTEVGCSPEGYQEIEDELG